MSFTAFLQLSHFAFLHVSAFTVLTESTVEVVVDVDVLGLQLPKAKARIRIRSNFFIVFFIGFMFKPANIRYVFLFCNKYLFLLTWPGRENNVPRKGLEPLRR